MMRCRRYVDDISLVPFFMTHWGLDCHDSQELTIYLGMFSRV